MSAPILDNDHISIADVAENLASLSDSQKALLVARIHQLIRPAKNDVGDMGKLADVLERLTRPAREAEAQISKAREMAEQAAND